MHEGDGHAALADGGRDALDRAEADVAAGEDARNTRLQQVRVAVELCPGWGVPYGQLLGLDDTLPTLAADPDTIRDAIKAVGEETQVTGERQQLRRKRQQP